MSPLPAAPLRERRWIPVLVVAAVIAGVVWGGYGASDALGKVRGGTVTVSATVQISPLPGWELAGGFTSGPEGVRLTNGSASLDVRSLPFSGSDVDLLAEYVQEALEPDAEQLQVSEEIVTVRLSSGLTGSRIAYVGLFGDVQAPIEGEVTVVVAPSGTGVIFDGWAPAGQLQFVIDDIETMIRRAEIA